MSYLENNFICIQTTVLVTFVLAKFVEESELPEKKNQQEPSSASLLSSLLSSLYEEEKQRKAEELKSEEYVYINHQSRSRHIGS